MLISDWSSDVCSSDLCSTWIRGFIICGNSQSAFVLIRSYRKNVKSMKVRPTAREQTAIFMQYRCQAIRDINPHTRVWSGRLLTVRSEERRVGKECVSRCESRWSRDLKKKTKTQ